MIIQHQHIDPVIRDLNNYLADQEQHDIKAEHFQAIAEKEYAEMNYLEIIEYGNNYTDLEFLFEFVNAGKIKEAQAALNNFIETVKDAYVASRIMDLAQDEENQRQADEAFEKYYAENPPYWC
jgi:hypothetical protein